LGSQTNTRAERFERGIFLLALTAVCAVAIVDVAIGDMAMIVKLLIIGPVIAAFGASSRHTGIVAVLALVVSVPLALANDAFGSTDHVTSVLAVGLVGGLAVGIAQLRSEREADSARLAVQYGLARVLAEADSVERAAPDVLEAIGAPLHWELGHLFEVRPGEPLRLVAGWRAPGVDAREFEEATRRIAFERGVGLPGTVWEAGEPTWLTDVIATGDHPRAAEAGLAGLRGGIGFPIWAGGRCAAVIEFFTRTVREPEEDTLALAQALGAMIGEFIESEQAGEEVVKARDQLTAILSGVADAVTAQGPDGQIVFANDASVELMGFSSLEELMNAPLDQLRQRFAIYDENGEPFPVARYPGRRALAGEGQVEAVMRLRMRADGEELWTNVKATPIYDGDGEVVMAINVTEDITTHIRAERGQRFLSRASALLSASLDPKEVLGQVAKLAVPEIADWLYIDLVVPGGSFERVAAAHDDPERLARAIEINREQPLAHDAPKGIPNVLRTGRSELYVDLQAELAADPEGRYFRLARELGMRSAIVAPMISRGRTVGTLTLATDPEGRRFDEHDLELAEELALRCGTAIDNARLFSERAYIARTLQQSLLPAELPDIPGIEAAARFRPTGQGNEVGGDFYDLFESGGQGWTVVMGDVCGKGPDAAAVTALARYTLRAAAMRERVPSRSLSLLNEALLRQRDDRRFCTVVYAYLERNDGGAQIGFASAGHPPPLLLRRDGSVEPVGDPGTLLGVLPDPRFEDRTLSLMRGDTLVFYTDGMVEGRGPGEVLDEARLAELLASFAGAGADAIAGRLEDAAVNAHGGSPRDDIAVLVLRVAE
jgi:PAS domain S-box-containing protein